MTCSRTLAQHAEIGCEVTGSDDKTAARDRFTVWARQGLRPNVCVVCAANDDIQAHHWCYGRPLNVIGLCLLCHRDVHTGAIPEPMTGRRYGREGRKDRQLPPLNTPCATPFATTIRDRRRQLGLRQYELAERLGWHFVRLNKIENGHQPPTASDLAALCNALDIPPHVAVAAVAAGESAA